SARAATSTHTPRSRSSQPTSATVPSNVRGVALETTVVPKAPYSLALSARMKSDTTRVFRAGVLTMAFEAADAPALAQVHQRPDGSLVVRVDAPDPDSALDRVRFVLAADDDHSPFLRRFARDPLVGHATRNLAGLRPL